MANQRWPKITHHNQMASIIVVGRDAQFTRVSQSARFLFAFRFDLVAAAGQMGNQLLWWMDIGLVVWAALTSTRTDFEIEIDLWWRNKRQILSSHSCKCRSGTSLICLASTIISRAECVAKSSRWKNRNRKCILLFYLPQKPIGACQRLWKARCR